MLKNILKIFAGSVVTIVILIVSILTLIQIPLIQTKLINQLVIPAINNQFGTALEIDSVDINFFGTIRLHQVKALDHHNRDLIDVQRIDISPNYWSFIRKESFKIDRVALYQPYVFVKTYRDESQDNFLAFIDRFSSKSSDKSSSNHFVFEGNLYVEDGYAEIINENLLPNESAWVKASHLYLTADRLRFSNSSLTADINQLRFEAKRNDLQQTVLKNLSGKFKYRDDLIALKDLDIETQHSHITGDFAFVYDSIGDYANFYDKVVWKVHLNPDSYVGMPDIRYFVPTWDSHATVAVRGDLDGSLSDLHLSNYNIHTTQTHLKGNRLRLRHIYDADTFKLSTSQVEAHTSYQDLLQILPSTVSRYIPKELDRFKQLNLNGKLELDPRDLSFQGNVSSSAVGDLKTDVLLNDYPSESIHYQGTLSTQQFKLGTLIQNDLLGDITTHINFEGHHYDLKNLVLQLDGSIESLTVNDETYQNISIDGNLASSQFNGFLAITDPKVTADLTGFIDFSSSIYRADFQSNISNLDLHRLGLFKQPNSFIHSMVDVKISGSSLDDLNSDISFTNITFEKDNTPYFFEHLYFQTSIDQAHDRSISLKADHLLSANIEGAFKLSQIWPITQNALGRAVAKYTPILMDQNQGYTFDIAISDGLLEIIDPTIHVLGDSKIVGKVTPEGNIVLKGQSSQITYETYRADNIQFNINTENPFFQTSVTADSIYIKGYNLKDVRLLSINRNDTVEIKSKFKGNFAGNIDQQFNLHLYQTYTEDALVKLGFKKSFITYNDNEWVLNPNEESDSQFAILDIKNDSYVLHGLTLESGTQKFSIAGDFSNQSLLADISVENTYIESLLAPMESLSVKGLANGTVHILYNQEIFQPIINLDVADLTINDYLFGHFKSSVTRADDLLYNVDTSLFDQDDTNILSIAGTIDPKNLEDNLNLKCTLNGIKMDILNSFLSGVMDKIRGDVYGEIDLAGSIDNLDYFGSLKLKNAGLRVSYLGVDYKIVNEPEILVSTGLFYLDIVQIQDVRSKTTAYLYGDLSHDNFLNWRLNNVRINADNLLVMDTNPNANPLFYGKVYANNLIAYLNGPAENLKVDVIAKTAEGTNLTINTSAQGLDISNTVVFIDLKSNGTNATDSTLPKIILPKVEGLNLNLNAEITPSAKLTMILDERFGDKIEAQGSGNILMDMNADGSVSMDGEVTLSRGFYNFSREVISKVFTLRKNSKIMWFGDMYNPELNIKAYYEKSVSNVSEYIDVYAQNMLTELEIRLTGSLNKLNIDFDILTPDAPESIKNNLALKFKNNDNELNIQFGSVLLLGRFFTESTTDIVSSGAISAAYELAFSQVSGLLSSLSRNFEIEMSYNVGSELYNTSDMINTKISSHVNDRITINSTVGVAVTSNNTGMTNNTQAFTGAVEVSTDITKEKTGKLNLRLFSRPTSFGVENFNAATTYSQAWGAGIYYHEDFNNFKEFRSKFLHLFDRKSSTEQRDSTEQSRLDSLDVSLQDSSSLFSPKPTVK